MHSQLIWTPMLKNNYQKTMPPPIVDWVSVDEKRLSPIKLSWSFSRRIFLCVFQ